MPVGPVQAAPPEAALRQVGVDLNGDGTINVVGVDLDGSGTVDVRLAGQGVVS